LTKILVTGATGNIGSMTLLHLLKRRPASEIVGLARDPSKARDLAEQGIEIRQGDYLDRERLVHAFVGIDKLMLVSATAFTDRNAQHENVVTAARQAGVRHIVYMPIIRKAGSTIHMPQITEEDAFVEERLKASGLTYTLLGHPPFLDNIELFFGGNAYQTGVFVPPGDGKAGYASRQELAEAHAVVLSQEGHENKRYALQGGPAVSFAEVAQIMSEISGAPVTFQTVPEPDYVARLVAAGLPEPGANFVLSWVKAINTGEWDSQSGDLERLLGRKPTAPTEFLRAAHAARQAAEGITP